uniref:Non-specific serine/threonine protein kinase n=1 Tax=Chenopodium quinoa TaxID=63459 RepID=A0A803KM10_CHEQI
MEFDGVLSWYYHPKSFAANKGVSWSNVKSLPDNICTTLAGVLDTGVCGYNSICSLGDGDRRPKCKCPPQYSLLDPNNRFGNCKPNFEQENCDEFGQGAIKDEYTLVQLDNVDWPLADYQQLEPYSKEECQSSCLNDCYCAVAIFNEQDQTCWKKKLPLTHGREDQGVNRIAFVKVRTNDGKLTVGQSLRATGNGSSILSPSGDFAFGFHQFPSNNDLFLLAIWYDKIPDTIVWYANDGNPVSQGSSVKITANEGLVLSDPQGTSLWNTTDAKKSGEAVNYGFMNDTGNFVLNSETDNVVWQSFDNPTDTLLPTQILQAGGQLHSRRSETNFTQGRFQLHLQSDGNLVLNTRDLATGNAYDPYYASHTDADGNPESAGDRVIYDKSGDLYILLKNRSRVDLTPADKLVSAQTNYQRVTLEFDGVLSWYYHPKSFAANKGVSWSNVKSLPDNICTTLSGVLDTGACGYNSICSLGDGDQRPKCRCPPNYSLLDPNDTYGSCKPDFKQDNCDEYGKGAIKDEYTLVRLVNIDWPLADYAQLKPCSKEECQSNCLNDCFCAVAIFNEQDQTCLKKKLPLTHGREDSGVHRIGWLKVGNGNGSNDPINPIHQNKVIYKKNAVFTALFGSSVCINFLLLSAIVLGVYLMYNKKNPRLLDEHHRNKTLSEYSSVHCFSYKELEDATDGFKEEIGRGAFGTVYKGKIGAGNSPITVAVKKLDRISKESDKEFKAEVNVIGQTHHKNLVRFIKFCKEEDHRLLVYEYMSNCTVADYLFGNLRPSWTARMQIVQGIAKGLLYLHEECSTQIIHCDIKPQNILLDDYYHARISDFGLAKLLVLNQSYTNTAVRGTKGYLAPEWFRNKPVTVKVDVYSFGVLLLETICCRRSVCMDISGEGAILTDWAFDCYQSNTLDALVNDDIEALHDKLNLERYIMVALWCIREDPSLRPTMKRVIQMLEGVAEVARPPCPTSFTVTTQP